MMQRNEFSYRSLGLAYDDGDKMSVSRKRIRQPSSYLRISLGLPCENEQSAVYAAGILSVRLVII